MHHRFVRVTRVFVLAAAASLAIACSAQTDNGDATEPSSAAGEDALSTSPRSVSLLYEGSCAFLHSCSSWSRRLPEGEVQWGCGGTDCSDDDLWIAGPSHAYCDRKAKICKGSTCVTAKVRDISDAKGWEASNGVLDALDLPHTVNVAACRGTGGGKVVVTLL